MNYQGDFSLGDTFDVKFTTVNPTTGAPFTLAGSPAVAAYPGNSTTEITAGIVLSVDFDSRTGLNNVRIVGTSANGYAVGNYNLVITAGTVNGVSAVGYVVGSFSIEARSVISPAAGVAAKGTLSGTHSTTTADLGANAPSYDISRMTLWIPGRGARLISSYNTSTGVATWDDILPSTPVDADPWYLYSTAPNAAGATPLDAAGTRAALGLSSANLTTLLVALQADTDDIQARIPAALVGGKMSSVSMLTEQMTESTAAVGVMETPAQALQMILRLLTNVQKSGTNLIVTGLDGVAPIMTIACSPSVEAADSRVRTA